MKKFINFIRANKWSLLIYDYFVIAFSGLIILYFNKSGGVLSIYQAIYHIFLCSFSVFACRIGFKIYAQVWRYGGIQSYVLLIVSDSFGFLLYNILQTLFSYIDSPNDICKKILFIRALCFCSINLLASLSIRMIYRYCYKFSNNYSFTGKALALAYQLFSGNSLFEQHNVSKKVNLAIVGTGDTGISLSDELLVNPFSVYKPICFIDNNKQKIGREIHGLPVLAEDNYIFDKLQKYGIQEVVLTVASADVEERKSIYNKYKNAGYNVKTYDYPSMQETGSKKRVLRDFDAQELLFRKQLKVIDEKVRAFYCDKTVLITGGGGSIGSELCRQIADMSPKKLIVLDIYENGAYDVQQELKVKYGKYFPIFVEIVSVCNKKGLERVFAEYKPNIVLNAAAHKHVPLMEKNCIEAIENNIFGTLNTVELSEKYGVERFIMVSTDKAVNPTNVMGATKRMCEMIVLSHAQNSSTTSFSCTRFGNVLGSAGSVIPLFKRQIAAGGPVTITDKRIIRYFMTIPEASQLVLCSGAIGNNGELFVLDMGNPVKIIDLAENMIRLSGLEPNTDIEIVETGLRPGEKLYEELLVKTEELDKTDNELIFIERDIPYTIQEIEEKLEILSKAVLSDDDNEAKLAMKMVVPTFKDPKKVNDEAEKSHEMKIANK